MAPRFTEKTRALRVGLVSALAGGATLAGEALGARLLRPLVGSTAAAQAGSVAGVLGGLGLGAWLASRKLQRDESPALALLTRALLALATLSALGPTLSAALTAPAARVLVSLSERSPGAGALAQSLATLALTLPFGALAGALYPCLAALHGRGSGRATAVTGAASSLGSALAAVVAAFVLAPALGVGATLWVGAGVYLAAAALAQSFAGHHPPGYEAEPSAPLPTDRERGNRALQKERGGEARAKGRHRVGRDFVPGGAEVGSGVVAGGSTAGRSSAAAAAQAAAHAARVPGCPSPGLSGEGRAGKPCTPGGEGVPVLASLALAGFASSAWQLTLARLGALAFGPSAFALAAAGAAHVAALALGESLVISRADVFPAPRRALRNGLLFAAVAGLLVSAVAWKLPGFSAAVFARGTRSMPALWGSALLALLALCAPVIAPLATAMPLSARALADAGENHARANGLTLAAMAAGNVLGALAGALVFLPRVGIHGMLVLCAAALALAALALHRREEPAPWAWAAALGLCAIPALRAWDSGALLTGPFLYAGAEDVVLGTLVRVDYGREATVAVRRDDAGSALLQIDGKVDATSAGDASTQLLVGVVPAVLCAHPREVLVVGLGSGMTVDAVRDVPGVARVDVTELLPEVVRAGREEFRAANHGVLSAPNVRVIEQDASLYLRGTPRRYDVIVSQPSNPWVAGMADLFTREALSAARARLNPGGVMAAWFHAYSTDAETFASVLATFVSVFPRAALVEVVPGQDYMVAGMVDPVGVDVDRAVAALASPALTAQLERAGVHDRGGFFGRFVAGVQGIGEMVQGAEVLRADDLRLEFRAPMLLYNDASAQIFALLERAQDLPLAGLSPAGAALSAVTDESEPTREAMGHVRQMVLAREANDLELAIRQGEQAVAASPTDRGVRGQLAHLYLKRAGRRYRRGDPGGAGDDLQNVLELDPGPAETFRARAVLGDLALSRNDFETAARHYGAALDVARSSGAPTPELHVRMAQVLISLGDVAHARAEIDRAIRECSDPARCEEMQTLRAQLR